MNTGRRFLRTCWQPRRPAWWAWLALAAGLWWWFGRVLPVEPAWRIALPFAQLQAIPAGHGDFVRELVGTNDRRSVREISRRRWCDGTEVVRRRVPYEHGMASMSKGIPARFVDERRWLTLLPNDAVPGPRGHNLVEIETGAVERAFWGSNAVRIQTAGRRGGVAVENHDRRDVRLLATGRNVHSVPNAHLLAVDASESWLFWFGIEEPRRKWLQSAHDGSVAEIPPSEDGTEDDSGIFSPDGRWLWLGQRIVSTADLRTVGTVAREEFYGFATKEDAVRRAPRNRWAEMFASERKSRPDEVFSKHALPGMRLLGEIRAPPSSSWMGDWLAVRRSLFLPLPVMRAMGKIQPLYRSGFYSWLFGERSSWLSLDGRQVRLGRGVHPMNVSADGAWGVACERVDHEKPEARLCGFHLPTAAPNIWLRAAWTAGTWLALRLFVWTIRWLFRALFGRRGVR